MTSEEYQSFLLDPRWQKKRLEIFARDEWRCVRCGNKAETLHVHHAYYIKDAMPWDHPGHCLSTVCATCHADEHGKTPRSNKRRQLLPVAYRPTSEELNDDLLRWLQCSRSLRWAVEHPGQAYVVDNSPPTPEERTRFEAKVRDYTGGIRQEVR